MQNNKIAFDVGANVGKCTEYLYQHYDLVISVEPIFEHCELLKRKFENKNVVIVNSLVSNNCEEKLFFEQDTISTLEENWTKNSRFSKNYEWKPPVKRKCTTLDNLVSLYGNPEFIKIDVEGHELEVLEGLNSCTPKIAFEWAEEFLDKTKRCLELLSSKGYKKFSICHMNDNISYSPQWNSFEDTFLSLKNMSSKTNNYHWGMIWCST